MLLALCLHTFIMLSLNGKQQHSVRLIQVIVILMGLTEYVIGNVWTFFCVFFKNVQAVGLHVSSYEL